jgi:hypothetical protein
MESFSAISTGIARFISGQPRFAAAWAATTLPPDPKLDETVITDNLLVHPESWSDPRTGVDLDQVA